MRNEERVLVTDTTMRDAHQSLIATRMRTKDIAAAAEAYAKGLPQLLSLECWGGATFDVSMRFLSEDPWERLALVRERAPNLSDADAAARRQRRRLHELSRQCRADISSAAPPGGMDLFRIFDCLNWVENMRVAIDAVCETGKLAEGAICYAGDILDPSRAKYSLDYYVRRREGAGARGLPHPRASRTWRAC